MTTKNFMTWCNGTVWTRFEGLCRLTSLFVRYYETNEMFDALDYAAATPTWAVYNAAEQGQIKNRIEVRVSPDLRLHVDRLRPC